MASSDAPEQPAVMFTAGEVPEETRPLRKDTKRSATSSLSAGGITERCCVIVNQCYHEVHHGCKKIHWKKRVRETFSVKTLHQRLPITQWLPKYRLQQFQGDLIAGITVGLTVIPQSLAYANIAELPPQYGLYSAFMSCFVYFLLGTSKDVNVGPTAVMSLLTAEFGHSIIHGDATYAIALAFINGLIQITMGLLRLGFIVDFISHPVINSFTTAAAITIASSQLKKLFGLHNIRRGFIYEVYDVCRKLGETQPWDLSLGLVCMLSLYLLKKMREVKWTANRLNGVSGAVLNKTIWILSTARNALIVLITAGLAAILYHNDKEPFTLTGNITGGLPDFKFPAFTITHENTTFTASDALSKMGFGLVVVPTVGLIEIIAVGKAFGRKNGYNIEANQEFLALGTANLLGSFLSAYPVTASFSRSAVNAQSGSMTTLAGVFTGLLVLLALAFLTPLFFYIPDAALAAVIIMAVTDMINFSMLKHLWIINKFDLLPWLTAFIISLTAGFEYGIVLGVLVSIMLLLHPWVRPPIKCTPCCISDVLGEKVGTDSERELLLVTIPMGIMFPSVEYLQGKITSLAINKSSTGENRSVIVDLAHVHTLDYSAAMGISHMAHDFKKLNTWLIFIKIQPSVRNTLRRAKVKIFEANSEEEAVSRILSESPPDDDEQVITLVPSNVTEFEPMDIDPSCYAYQRVQYKAGRKDDGKDSDSDGVLIGNGSVLKL